MKPKIVHPAGVSGCGSVPRRWPLRAVLMAGLLCLWTSPSATAQSLAGQLREMRQEIEALQDQVGTLKGLLQQTQAEVAALQKVQAGDEVSRPLGRWAAPARPASPAPSQAASTNEAAPAQPSAGELIPLLESEISDQAQTKVESNSRLPVKIFGTVVTGASFNSGAVNWLDDPSKVLTTPRGSLPSSSFSISLRQSRLGAMVNGPTLGGWKARGLIVADFFAGSTALNPDTVMPVPRLLYAYGRLERGRTAIEVGEEQMILAPGNPTSIAALAFPDLYQAGNLYLRAPQVRVEQTFAAGKNGEFDVTAGILDPDAGDGGTPVEFAPANFDGELAHRPAVEARLAWRTGAGDSGRFEMGVSGDRGSERFATGSVPSWAGALDFDAQGRHLGWGGKWYVGRNIAAFGAAVGQFAKSSGGYAEARLKPNERLSFNSGFGTDRLFDIRALPVRWTRNSGVFVNTIYQFTPELEGSAEYRWLSTVSRSGVARRNNLFDFVVAYSF